MKVIIGLVILLAIGAVTWFSSQPEQVSHPMQNEDLPVISRQDILDASDLLDGVKQALAQDDEDMIDEWLSKAVDVAKSAKLPKQDISYLQSDMAKDYVIFHAKRSLFNDAVEQAYYALTSIDDIKTQYPEAQDLFANADKLIAERNNILEQIASELANGEQLTDNHRDTARQQWIQRFNAQADMPNG
ncbi:hypothetical protein [Paraglaciecola sp. L1A13]|uniref:hypothetical protein n=1 Tax=Paraglaciecola sp. L1A13 TaxID=2686359 RepID=UPI00131D40DA|nr:hypothetical protein [Paraglaciecola sp. L1A13]